MSWDRVLLGLRALQRANDHLLLALEHILPHHLSLPPFCRSAPLREKAHIFFAEVHSREEQDATTITSTRWFRSSSPSPQEWTANEITGDEHELCWASGDRCSFSKLLVVPAVPPTSHAERITGPEVYYSSDLSHAPGRITTMELAPVPSWS